MDRKDREKNNKELENFVMTPCISNLRTRLQQWSLKLFYNSIHPHPDTLMNWLIQSSSMLDTNESESLICPFCHKFEDVHHSSIVGENPMQFLRISLVSNPSAKMKKCHCHNHISPDQPAPPSQIRLLLPMEVEPPSFHIPRHFNLLLGP